MKRTFANIHTGDRFNIVTMGVGADVTFLGYTNIDKEYSDEPRFDNLRQVKKFYGVSTAEQIERLGDVYGKPYGHSVYACFKEHNGDGTSYRWQAYLYKGKWCCGTSADAIRIVQNG